MSSTRHAAEGSPFRQEKFCSSFERGLMANLVAKRCTALTDAADRDLVWWLQQVSHGEGGLEAFTQMLIERFPDRLGTTTMVKLGFGEKRIYSADEVRKVRGEFPKTDAASESRFLLQGEATRLESEAHQSQRYRFQSLKSFGDTPSFDPDERYLAAINRRPSTYAAAEFSSVCSGQAKAELCNHLQQICLDPTCAPADWNPHYFSPLVDTLRQVRDERLAAIHAGLVKTEITCRVFDALEYALEERCLVLIEGIERIGKSFGAQKFAALNPGRVRYVQVPASNDDAGFFRRIAEALGVSVNLNSKSHQLRDRIEETLQGGNLMLVLDEAHYLWPQSKYREALPSRINWLMTALVNFKVPVAICCTPQFFAHSEAVKRRTGWRDGQFIGRVAHFERLPQTLSEDDLRAVAENLYPEGDAKSHTALVKYATSSAKYLAAIDVAVKRARFDARRRKLPRLPWQDLVLLIQGSVLPSDTLLADAVSRAPAGPRRAGGRHAAAVPPMDCNDVANPPKLSGTNPRFVTLTPPPPVRGSRPVESVAVG